MLRTLEQNTRLHKLIGLLAISKENKEQLVFGFSGERTSTSKELTFEECNRLNNHLQSLVQQSDDRADVMRKKVLSICHEMKWKLESGKIDWEHLNDWLDKYGYLHKSLNEYTEKELPKLVTQFENLLRDYLKKL